MQEIQTYKSEIEKYKNGLQSSDKYKVLKSILKLNNWKFVNTVLENFYKEYRKVPYLASDETILEWCHKIAQGNRKLSTLRAYFIGMKRIFNIAMIFGVADHNAIQRLEDMKAIKIPSSNAGKEVPELDVSLNKIECLIANKNIPDRAKAIVLFLGNTGCRVSELVNLKNSYISKAHGKPYYKIELYEPKTNKTRTVNLPDTTFEWIRKHINKASKWRNSRTFAKGNEYLLYNNNGEPMTTAGVRWIVKYYWGKLFDQDYISPHKFRHWLITHKALVEKLPIAQISKEMGHASIHTTMRYTHVRTDMDFYNTIKTPDMTEKPKVVIVDKTAKFMARAMGVVGVKSDYLEDEADEYVGDESEVNGQKQKQNISKNKNSPK